jgi:hypothetical protein
VSPYTIAALCISLVALIVTLMNYRRKAGRLIRGSFSVASSVSCDDPYLSKVVIENLKDRALTIFGIYLKVGSNCYIEIEDFESAPLILRAFETYHKQYGPIEFYGVNLKRTALRGLLSDPNIKKHLVLSTSEGKYVVPAPIRTWSPVETYFKNHLTAVVRPVRSTYKGRDIGSNVQFVIAFVSDDGTEEIVPVHPNDYQVVLFRRFQLSKEALATKETLEAYLRTKIEEGTLVCKSFTVVDMQDWRARAHSQYTSNVIEAPVYSRFQYYIVGKVVTWHSNRKEMRARNRALVQSNRSRALEKPLDTPACRDAPLGQNLKNAGVEVDVANTTAQESPEQPPMNPVDAIAKPPPNPAE